MQWETAFFRINGNHSLRVPLNPFSFRDVECTTYVGSEEVATLVGGESSSVIKLFLVTFRAGECSSDAFLDLYLGGTWFESRG